MAERPDLNELVRKAQERFNALSPRQKREHRAAQRKSWVVGEMMLEYSEMTREYAERLFDETVNG